MDSFRIKLQIVASCEIQKLLTLIHRDWFSTYTTLRRQRNANFNWMFLHPLAFSHTEQLSQMSLLSKFHNLM